MPSILPCSAVGGFGFPFTNCRRVVLGGWPWPSAGDGDKINLWFKLKAWGTFTDLLPSTGMGKTDLAGWKLVYFQWIQRSMMRNKSLYLPQAHLHASLPDSSPIPAVQGWGMEVMGTPQKPHSLILPTPSPCPTGMSPHHRGASDGNPQSPSAPRHRQKAPLKHIFTSSVFIPQLWEAFQV